MYPSSAAFKAAVLTDHVVVSKAEVWASDQKLREIDIADGTVTVDSSSAVRRTCEVVLVTNRESTNLVPDNDFDLLTPFGNELRLFRGVQYSDGTKEYVPLGFGLHQSFVTHVSSRSTGPIQWVYLTADYSDCATDAL